MLSSQEDEQLARLAEDKLTTSALDLVPNYLRMKLESLPDR